MKCSFKILLFFIGLLINSSLYAQIDPLKPDFTSPKLINGMKLVWNDEFNIAGKPDTSSWIYEKGFVRNQELQWYKPDNANCRNGLLIIEGRKGKEKNPNYIQGNPDWKRNREFIEYSSASSFGNSLKPFSFLEISYFFTPLFCMTTLV
jgi:hypothetical protein